MTRGTMYNIATDPEQLAIDESDFYDHVETLGSDYVQNYDEETSRRETDRLRKALDLPGLVFWPGPDGNWPGTPGYGFDPDEPPENAAFAFIAEDQAAVDEAKRAWFKDSLERLKSLVAGMDLDKFALGTSAAHDIKSLADDGYSDAVYLDTGTGPAVYTMDTFIRNLHPRTAYFVCKDTVKMH